MKTIAEQIATQFDDDGSKFEDSNGKDLFSECEKQSEDTDQNWERGSTRYTFNDDSVITISGDGWDLGYVNCHCWRDAGHSDYCELIKSN